MEIDRAVVYERFREGAHIYEDVFLKRSSRRGVFTPSVELAAVAAEELIRIVAVPLKPLRTKSAFRFALACMLNQILIRGAVRGSRKSSSVIWCRFWRHQCSALKIHRVDGDGDNVFAWYGADGEEKMSRIVKKVDRVAFEA